MANMSQMGDMPDQQAAPEDDSTDASAGYCIELRVDGSGKMSVGVEPLAQEQVEEGATETGEEDYKPVANLSEAMRLIKEIIAHAGNMTDVAASQDEMASGYGKDGM